MAIWKLSEDLNQRREKEAADAEKVKETTVEASTDAASNDEKTPAPVKAAARYTKDISTYGNILWIPLVDLQA